ncbi:MAG TPA: hypothetical protein VL651_09440 [Bacteroidia bacterium]|nr:hypothetical protein [Bacteroidia bacterium]
MIAGISSLFAAVDNSEYKQFSQGYQKCEYIVESMVVSDHGKDSILDGIQYRIYEILVLNVAIREQLDEHPEIMKRQDTLSLLLDLSDLARSANDSLLSRKENFAFLLLRHSDLPQLKDFFILADSYSVFPRSANCMNYVYGEHFYIGNDPSHITILPDTFKITKADAQHIAEKRRRYYRDRGRWFIFVLPEEDYYCWTVYSHCGHCGEYKKYYVIQVNAMTGKVMSKRKVKPRMAPD